MDREARRAYAYLAGLLVAGLTPALPQTVSQLAAAERFVGAESGSPYPGKWDNERVPLLLEVMDTCGLDHPSRKVTVLASAQSAKSEAVMNAIFHTAKVGAIPILIMLPSISEAAKYNRYKLQVAIDTTPAFRRLVTEITSRDETGSTTMSKRLANKGSITIVNAGSSKALQMISAAYRVYEEPTGYPSDVGGRGDPISQADARGKAYRERGDKSVLVGTPGLKSDCRITKAYEASDQRRFYVPCPHCGCYQVLKPSRLRAMSDKLPHRAYFECAASGCVIEPLEKAQMLARGAWIKTYPSEDPANPAPLDHFQAAELAQWQARAAGYLEPGFHWWQAYSPFVSWDDTKAEEIAAEGQPALLKVLYQQTYGEAWEDQGEAPDADRLLERRQAWPPRRLPAGVLFSTGAVDVQANRLEWAVYGWSRGLGGYTVDRGIILGDPSTDEPWLQLQRDVLSRTYQDAWGAVHGVEVWGVDTGYLSQSVYRFVRQYALTDWVRALDGRKGWGLPPLGKDRAVDVDWNGRKLGEVKLWPVGTWGLKAELYGKLKLTVQGPDETGVWPVGSMWFDNSCDAEYFEQLTSEFVADVTTKTGHTERRWIKVKSRRNEQLDLAVYCLALARGMADQISAARWAEIEQERLGPAAAAQLDLAVIWAPGLARPAVETMTPPPGAAFARPGRGVRSAGVA